MERSSLSRYGRLYESDEVDGLRESTASLTSLKTAPDVGRRLLDSDTEQERESVMDESVTSVPETPKRSTSSFPPTNTTSSEVEDPKVYVKRLLKQHFHLGHITSYQFTRILERASRKVEQAKVKSMYIDKQRVKRLVDEFVKAYTDTNPEM